MNFPSIDIQGSVLSSDLLGKIRSEQASFQQGKDFNPHFNNAKLKDEISLAWQEAKGQWVIFQSKLKRVDPCETAATETRSFWMLPLLSNLGYDFQYLKSAEEINGKTFWINNRDNNLGGFPLFIAGYNESLDRRPENKTLRVSPHALVQEYLNYSEHLYGLVTNGKLLRLLRDASRLTRLSYVEFNLEKIMEEDLYSDFVLLYRLLHASRMPRSMNEGAESIIEKYHQEGLEAGATIRNKLGNAVKGSIKALANGFINHPENTELRTAFEEGKLDLNEFYRQQLRIIYRLLFLFVIEERNLVYAESKDPQVRRFSQIYHKYYSLLRLRRLAKHLPPPDSEKHYDHWLGLINTFALFEDHHIGEKLGIMALKGDLFGYSALSAPSYDLHHCKLSNAILQWVLNALGYFENDNKVLIAVNYGGLDVEEFGSVYEGLLELKLKVEQVPGTNQYSCTFDESSERSSSGSHYTPEELVQPLIKHSLEYQIQDRVKPFYDKKADKETTVNALLSLKICDVACGSGHILLSAARRIALEVARVKTGEEQPNPKSIRKALREVIRHCIYGVDKNPLAVELCKVALWLEAHNPGEPLSFLDHHIKCGDAIVGLAHREELEKGIADEAFKTLPGDDKDIAKTFRDQNIKERKARLAKDLQLKAEFEKTTANSVNEAIAEYRTFNALPENTPEEIERKAKAYRKFMDGKGYNFLKAMANTQVAQFFIPKNLENKDALMTDAEFRLILSGYQGWQDRKVAKAYVIASEKRFFHWFLEFPEVFGEGGFDCILGNPPFLGGQKLTGTFGDNYLEYIKYQFAPIGAVDLVTYFFRRIFTLISKTGFQSLISTNTIAQGRSREDGLDLIVKQGGTLNHAVKSMRWPGLAAVEVALVTVTKLKWKAPFVLSGLKVNTITPYLDDSETLGNPFPLKQNDGKSFQGSIVLGKGFVLEPKQAQALIKKDPKNADVLFPYLNGDDLNNNPDQSPSRWVINFFDWTEDKAKTYSECYSIIEKLVKPERIKVNREIRAKYWWRFAERADKLYNSIKNCDLILVSCRISKYINHSFIDVGFTYDVATNVVNRTTFYEYAFLQASIHNEWAWKYASTLESRIRYLNIDCIDTFPIIAIKDEKLFSVIENIGYNYHDHRRQLMLSMQLGLTKTYNLFHSKDLARLTPEDENLDDKTFEKRFGKDALHLRKHLAKTPGTCSFNEAIEGIIKLRQLHVEMDNAILEAYGWAIDSAQAPAIQLRHNFYEVDYLPENDRVRYTIHPDARKEILKRLLELNHKIHEEEVKAGLWDKKKLIKETKPNKTKTPDPNAGLFGYGGLWDNIGGYSSNKNNNAMKEFSLNEGIYSVQDVVKITHLSAEKVKRWFRDLSIENYEGLSSNQKSDVESMRISFHGLIELVVIGTLRDNGFTLNKILFARKDLQSKTGKYYPFATNNVKEDLKVIVGKSIIFNFPSGFVTLDGTGQYNLSFIKDFFENIEFDIEGVARRLFPLGNSKLIVIDPTQGGGKAVISGKGVWVETISRLYSGDDSMQMLKKQYDLNEKEILAALEYSKQ